MLRRDFVSAALALSVDAVRGQLNMPGAGARSVLDYGAKPDGRTLNTKSIQRAIDDAFQSGGGTVHVPSGMFLTGRIDLKSRVTLYLDAGSTLLGSASLGDYADANGDMHQRHLIFAMGAEDVTLAGPGRIDGQGPSFWEPSGRPPKPPDDQWADVASHSMKPKASGRPSPMLYFVNCNRLHIEDVQIENSPGWTLNTVNCDGVEIHGISIKNPTVGPNTDGIDITGCQNVVVSNCSIDTGDDAVCLKTVNPFGPEPRLVKNVLVTNCNLTTCCNGFKLGTESEGGFENITFSDSVVSNGEVDFQDRVISGVAIEVVDGGWIDGVKVSGIQMQRARAPIFIRLGNRKQPYDNPQRGLRNVSIQDIQASEALMPSSITGYPGMAVEEVTLSNVRANNVLACRPQWVGRAVPEKDSAYPEAWMFGMLPASGLYARHVRGLHLNNLALDAAADEARPTIILDDVTGARIAEFSSTPVVGQMPVVELSGCQDVQITNSAAPAGTGTFVAVNGSESAGIVLSGDDLSGARQAFALASDVPPDAVTVSGNATAN